MDNVAKAAPYFRDPVILIGLIVLVVVLTARQIAKAGVFRPLPDSSPFRALKLSHVFLLGFVVIGAGVYLKHIELRADPSPKVADQSENSGMLGEVDYGFVELNPGQAMPIPSYRHGGNMVLYAGEEFRFQVLADSEIPAIELRVGDSMQLLSASEGKLKIAGSANQPLPAMLFASGSRISLPGGAPPRLSIKVQVYGTARPKSK